jgi:hypothetical protein
MTVPRNAMPLGLIGPLELANDRRTPFDQFEALDVIDVQTGPRRLERDGCRDELPLASAFGAARAYPLLRFVCEARA